VRRRSALALFAAALVVAAGLAACTSGSNSSSASSPTTLNVLAGSELSDMVPILDAAKKATGVTVKLTYTGSLDGAEKVAAGGAGDVAWFASDKYIALANASSKVLDKQSTMVSPVILGVKHSAAAALGWAPPATVGWKDVAAAAGAGKFHYAMTNPTASNSGFSALVGVATALAGSQALSPSTIDAAGLKSFFAGQAVTSGSSGFLVDAYVGNQDHLDGMVNYESVLMGLNAGPRLHEKLDLVYPSEGIVTADYPLMLLNGSKRAAYTKVVQYLRNRDVQARIQRDTSRRPAVPGVPLDPKFTQSLLVEAPFPANLSVVQQLLDDYQTTLRKPAHTFYALDTSGSMQGDRLNRLKAALNGLAGADTSFSGHFARFAPREKVTLIPFASNVNDTRTFDIDSTDPNSPGLTDLRNYVDGLQANGGTAIYSALDQAYSDAATARQAEPDSYISIVLMTDGENNQGISADRFLADVRRLPPDVQNVRVFSVLFGEANPAELQQIADATGGKVFDARTANLADVFKEIRGYQ
jgi:Ca-activated chloride channel family protein